LGAMKNNPSNGCKGSLREGLFKVQEGQGNVRGGYKKSRGGIETCKKQSGAKALKYLYERRDESKRALSDVERSMADYVEKIKNLGD